MSKINFQKGISILYVVFIMSILLVISFSISTLLIGQIKMVGEMGYSIVAFYAADSGIEEILMDKDNPQNITKELDNGAKYEVSFLVGGDEGCNEKFSYCITSVGSYRDTKRAIEINY